MDQLGVTAPVMVMVIMVVIMIVIVSANQMVIMVVIMIVIVIVIMMMMVKMVSHNSQCVSPEYFCHAVVHCSEGSSLERENYRGV